jgi:cell wall-associated NlpC family hydrolase
MPVVVPSSALSPRLVLLPLVAMALLVATSLVGAPAASAMTRAHRVIRAFSITRHQEGDPYAYGAAGPNRFDCSGLVYYSFRRAGFRHIPRTAAAQAGHTRRIRKSRVRVGDLVFFYNGAPRSGNVYHVGVFSGWHHGRRTIIHAPHSGQRVHRAPIWTRRWFAGTLRGLR